MHLLLFRYRLSKKVALIARNISGAFEKRAPGSVLSMTLYSENHIFHFISCRQGLLSLVALHRKNITVASG